MSEHLSNLGISVDRLKSYVAAAAIITGLLFASRGVCAAAQQGDPLDRG